MFSQERLRTTADYSSFGPQSLACQTLSPISDGFYSNNSSSSNSNNNLNSSTSTPSSLAAISSSNGILLFQTNTPYEPTLILSHHNIPQYSSSIINLSFSRQASQNKLASTHSNDVLIWDTSGQSLQPLVARLSTRNQANQAPFSTTKMHSSYFIALEWNKHNDTIITSAQNILSLWDIRSPRPASTFASRGQATIISISSSFVDHEFACMDTNGTVRIYDDRANHFNSSRRGRGYSNSATDELYHFRAHEASGIGVASIQIDGNTNTFDGAISATDNGKNYSGYITWGLDNGNDGNLNSTVKVWGKGHSQNINNIAFDNDAYWCEEDGNNANGGSVSNNNNSGEDTDAANFECHSNFSINNLSSLRVCPAPFFGFVTVSTPNSCDWQVDLWALAGGDNSAQVEHVALFSSADDNLTDMIGRKLGGRHLIASELALGSGLTVERHEKKRSATTPAEGQDVELIICCLDNAGYVTTQAIPEAVSLRKKSNPTSHGNEHEYQVYFKKNKSENNVKIFQQSNSDPDLASKEVVIKRGRGASDTDLHYDKLKLTSSVAADQQMQFSALNQNAVDGGFVQLRVEDQLFYDNDGDLNDEAGLSNQGLGNMQVHNQRGIDTSQDLDLMHKDESEDWDTAAKNVPCPRLCGAAFGLGGGLVCFQNGEVKKMWNWFSTSHSSQSSNVRASSVKRMLSTDSLDGLQHFQKEKDGETSFDSILADESDSSRKKDQFGFPRSLWDLTQMNKEAKFAQWGKEDNEDDVDEMSPTDDERDTSDDEYSDDSSEDDEDDEELDSEEGAEAMCDNYFGKNSQSFGLPQYSTSIFEHKATINSRQRSDSFLGPTTESLGPTVFYTTKYDDIVLNGQSRELADLWLFGLWGHEDNARSIEMQRIFDSEDDEMSVKELTLTHGELPDRVLHNGKSDSTFEVSHKGKTTTQSMLDNLKKLHSFGREGTITPSTFTSSVPLDKKIICPDQPESKGPLELKGRLNRNSNTITYFQQLIQAKKICIHNGKVASRIGQHTKADVWNLLAEILDNMTSGIGDEYDGWKGFGFGSLGRSLIQEIFAYYERQGDVQMLATIVSVIRRGRGSQGRETNIMRREELLLPGENKYDVYLHLYAKMLYSWGRVQTSTELKKHLYSSQSSGVIAETCSPIFAPHYHNKSQNLKHDEYNRNAWQCSICTNSVRGLFTVCFLCGHGGHLQCLMEWFSEQTVCPTGCGCSCKFDTNLG